MTAGDAHADLNKITDFKKCNVFDGVDDYVEIPHSAAQLGENLTDGFTISAWINPKTDGETSEGRILDKSTGTTGGAGFGLYASITNSIRFRMNAGGVTASANNRVHKGTWTHVLVTVSSGQLANFYISGTLEGTANQNLIQAISTITTTNAMRIGNRATATDRTFDGGIKDVKMWNKVLTTAERTQDYNGAGLVTKGLIHHIKLGGDYADYGSVGATATNSGSRVMVKDGKLAKAIQTARALGGATDNFILAAMPKNPNVLSVVVEET